MTRVSPFKAVHPSMMDLVIKRLWPTLITHLAHLHTGRCLPPISTFKSPQLESDHPVLPGHRQGDYSTRVPTQKKVLFIPLQYIFARLKISQS